MNRKILITFVTAVLAVVVILLVFDKKKVIENKYTVGSVDGVNARVEYEIRMLKDPHTGEIPDNYRLRELKFADEQLQKQLLKTQNNDDKIVYDYDWKFAGPLNVGGRTRAFAFDVSNEDILIAGGVSGGMYKSIDAGETWRKTSSNSTNLSSSCLAQDKRQGKTNVWYYGTGELLGNSASVTGAPYRGTGIFKSTDNGESWQLLPSTSNSDPSKLQTPYQYCWNICVDHTITDKDVVYVATVGGIYKSEDGGDTWTLKLGEFSNNMSRATDILITPEGKLYATLSSSSLSGGYNSVMSGFYKSDDGETWTKITPIAYPPSFDRTIMAYSPDEDKKVYFLSNTPGTGLSDHMLFAYNPTSDFWMDLTSNIPLDNQYGYDSQGAYDMTVAVSEDNPDIVFIGGTCLYRSMTGFTTQDWKVVGGYNFENTPLPLYDNSWVDYHVTFFSKSHPKRLYAGSDGGVRYIDDVTVAEPTWISLNTNYATGQFYSVAFDKDVNNSQPFIVGGLQDRGLYASTLKSEADDWSPLPISGDGAFCEVADGAQYYYVSTQFGHLMQAKVGSSETNYSLIRPNVAAALFVNPYVLDPNNSNIMYYIGTYFIYRNLMLESADVVNAWEQLLLTYTNTFITAVTVSTTPANILLFGTQDSRLFRVKNAHLPDIVKEDITASNFPENAYISSICIDPKDANHIMVVFSNYNINSIYLSKDGGATFDHIGGNLDDPNSLGPSVRWGNIVSSDDDEYAYFVGTSVGIYATSDISSSDIVWEKQGISSVGNSIVSQMRVRSDGVMIAGTHGSGVYQAKYKGLTGIDERESENNFLIDSYYPVPMKDILNIDLNLKKPTNIKISVFDMKGSLQMTPDFYDMPSGDQRIILSTQDLNSGNYIIRLEANGSQQAFKVMK
ncbi:MAG: T9SS type A sorting domain-containing protein [Hyphomicrobiales bacterium]